MDREVIDLLCDIPSHVDYTSVAEDLDAEDISETRRNKIKELLHSADEYTVFQAAKLLTFWGDDVGFNRLTELFNQGKLNGWIDHRLHGYDDTLQHVLRAFIRYWADKYDQGEGDYVKSQIFPYVSKIINLSNVQPFEISSLFRSILNKDFEEYIPLVKEHLEKIIDHPEIHFWKIHDAIELFLKIDPDFVYKLLDRKGKTLKDFNVEEVSRPSVHDE